jgi:XTP/dITP diphosphohydrolase
LIVYCATTNTGKIREFQMAADRALIIEPLPGLKEIAPPEETGTTFAENAIQKALYYARFTDGWLFAEDSGIEVDALGGEPGVYSARFSGPEATDESNNLLLLERMAAVADRTARYVCAIALVHGGELVTTFRGMVDGRIMDAPRGSGGFGYDPLFFYPPFGATFGEVERERKQSVSHRGEALKKLVGYLQMAG